MIEISPLPENSLRLPLYARADLGAVYLPVGKMLQIDRVVEVTDNEVHGEMDLEAHWVFPLHFPLDPIFPASLMIEAAGQALAVWAWHHRIAGHPRLARVKASFVSGVEPKDGVLTFHGRVRRRGHICQGIVDLACGTRRVARIEETLAFI